jgi:hypothetical protein
MQKSLFTADKLFKVKVCISWRFWAVFVLQIPGLLGWVEVSSHRSWMNTSHWKELCQRWIYFFYGQSPCSKPLQILWTYDDNATQTRLWSWNIIHWKPPRTQIYADFSCIRWGEELLLKKSTNYRKRSWYRYYDALSDQLLELVIVFLESCETFLFFLFDRPSEHLKNQRRMDINFWFNLKAFKKYILFIWWPSLFYEITQNWYLYR